MPNEGAEATGGPPHSGMAHQADNLPALSTLHVCVHAQGQTSTQFSPKAFNHLYAISPKSASPGKSS